MRIKNIQHAQYGRYAAMRPRGAVTTLHRQIGDHVARLKPRCKVPAAADAGNRWVLMLKVGLPANGIVHKRFDVVVLARLNPSSRRDQRGIRIDVKARHGILREAMRDELGHLTTSASADSYTHPFI
jgi:hypothetical protein